jgi:hypothetical protein
VEGDSESGFSGIGAAMPGHPNGWGNDFYELLTALPLQIHFCFFFAKIYSSSHSRYFTHFECYQSLKSNTK